ncbi:hypothetical protein ALC60_11662 [Trachymyrmex zeteki]|uniref:Uncharacterized protein n=1 Tax=Mycetomoellerius zeteki TaxID=64791 RepID=A0A151WN91_9HYME|nr:hypothetical protein ALC60_11662 [Trachymyrmex zeteki]
MRLTKGGEADAAAATTAASTASADQEKWFWHADSKPVSLPFPPSPLALMQLHHPLSPTTHPFFATLCMLVENRRQEPNWIRINRNSTKSSKSDPILIYQDRVKAHIQLEVGGKQEVEGEAGTLDVTAFTLATLFRTAPVDEWYNQRSRGTPVLDEDGRE